MLDRHICVGTSPFRLHHRACSPDVRQVLLCMQKAHRVTRPVFRDLNTVAAHSLASLLCPAHLRPISQAPSYPGQGTAGQHTDSRCQPRASQRPAAPRASDQPNSVAALAHTSAHLGRRVCLGDVLCQVQLICAVAHPCLRGLRACVLDGSYRRPLSVEFLPYCFL
jgi:hypothetical protein